MEAIGSIFFTIGIIMTPLALLFLIVTLILRAGLKKRIAEGIEGMGIITDKLFQRGKNTLYFIEVKYKWNDTQFTKTFQINRKLFETLPKTGEVLLSINPQNPSEAYMEGAKIITGGLLVFMILTIVFGALGLTYLVLGIIFLDLI